MDVKISDEEFVNVCNESRSMAEAARILNIPFSTFKRKAIKLGCYNTNQSGKGITKDELYKYTLEEIYSGVGTMSSYNLKNRLYKEELKENKCDVCGISEWNGNNIKCELHHKDGNPKNNKLENLQILCPNCHSQTDNFRVYNKKEDIVFKKEINELYIIFKENSWEDFLEITCYDKTRNNLLKVFRKHVDEYNMHK